MSFPYPNAHVASVLTGPRGHQRQQFHQQRDHKVPCPKDSCHLWWQDCWHAGAASSFEGNITVNRYTLPIIPVELASIIKEQFITAGKSPVDNPIKNIPLAIQQLGDQLAIIPLICHPVQARGGGKVAAPLGLQEPDGNDGAAAEDGDAPVPGQEAVPATSAGSEEFWAGKSSLETEALFSQQFQLQQRLEDLHQEILSLFGHQQPYLQNINTNVWRIAIQPVVCFSSQQRGSGGVVTHGSHGTLNKEVQATSMICSSVKLSKYPKDLYTVWKEWEFGLKGAKAAKDFTYHERGGTSSVTVGTRFFGML